MDKKLWKIGLLFVAAFFCCTIVSCSNDDDDNSGIVRSGTTGKKLVKMVVDYVDETYTFSYDSNNKLVLMERDRGYALYTHKYTWEENTIIENMVYTDKWGDDSEKTYTYILQNGLVETCYEGSSPYTFEYNSSNEMTRIWLDSYYTLVWDNHRPISILYEDDPVGYVTYSGQICNGYFIDWIFGGDYDDYPLVLAHPELFGLYLNQLPSKSTGPVDDVRYTVEYSYELDSDNYVTRCTYYEDDGYSEDILFEWE